MCITEEDDNTAQMRMFSSGNHISMAKSHYQYGLGYSVQIILILSTAEDVQYAANSNLSIAELHYQYN